MNGLTPVVAVPLGRPVAWSNHPASDLLSGQILAGTGRECCALLRSLQPHQIGGTR